jgi:4,5-DOPA dioxygenase extradiol
MAAVIKSHEDLDQASVAAGSSGPALRRRGVLVIASGNVVHNLRAVNWKLLDGGYDWAHRFNEAAKSQILSAPVEIATLDAPRDYRDAVPTPDHFLPLLYLAGLAEASADNVDVLVEGYTYGSLSMTAYTLGLAAPREQENRSVTASLGEAPADGSNM